MFISSIEWSEERIQEAMDIFKPMADEQGKPFTRQDAIESLDNLVAFFEILLEADRELRKKVMQKFISVIKQLQGIKAAQNHFL